MKHRKLTLLYTTINPTASDFTGFSFLLLSCCQWWWHLSRELIDFSNLNQFLIQLQVVSSTIRLLWWSFSFLFLFFLHGKKNSVLHPVHLLRQINLKPSMKHQLNGEELFLFPLPQLPWPLYLPNRLLSWVIFVHYSSACTMFTDFRFSLCLGTNPYSFG